MMGDSVRRVLFLTGTRADFGKIKPLIQELDGKERFDCSIFVTGMHMLSEYGYTADEVYKALDDQRLSLGFRRIYTYVNQFRGESMEMVLSNTVSGLSRYVHEFEPDLIVIHGDRVEALAGAIVGSLRNILVAHIEGGELSGTIDEVIRHAVSKMSNIHFVANQDAGRRLMQLGEEPSSIFTIGSPDIDVMLSSELPELSEVREHYDIPYDRFGIAIYHPVTTNQEETAEGVKAMVDAMLSDDGNYLVIYPNNDEGCERVFQELERLKNKERFRLYPSLRFESFLTLLKHAEFIIGNSSAGIREAPVYGTISINISSRQRDRFDHHSIINVESDVPAISGLIEEVRSMERPQPCYHFGEGKSAALFLEALEGESLWSIPHPKGFVDAGISEVVKSSR